MFEAIKYQVINKFKESTKATSPENYTVFLLYYMIEHKLISNQFLDRGF